MSSPFLRKFSLARRNGRNVSHPAGLSVRRPDICPRSQSAGRRLATPQGNLLNFEIQLDNYVKQN